MRWFISYRKIDSNFLEFGDKQKCVSFHNIITNISPSEWMREHSTNYNIMYAEQISDALASELVHGGPGIPAEYFEREGGE